MHSRPGVIASPSPQMPLVPQVVFETPGDCVGRRQSVRTLTDGHRPSVHWFLHPF